MFVESHCLQDIQAQITLIINILQKRIFIINAFPHKEVLRVGYPIKFWHCAKILGWVNPNISYLKSIHPWWLCSPIKGFYLIVPEQLETSKVFDSDSVVPFTLRRFLKIRISRRNQNRIKKYLNLLISCPNGFESRKNEFRKSRSTLTLSGLYCRSTTTYSKTTVH